LLFIVLIAFAEFESETEVAGKREDNYRP